MTAPCSESKTLGKRKQFTRPKSAMRYMKQLAKGRDATPNQRPWQHLVLHVKNEGVRQRAWAGRPKAVTKPLTQGVCEAITNIVMGPMPVSLGSARQGARLECWPTRQSASPPGILAQQLRAEHWCVALVCRQQPDRRSSYRICQCNGVQRRTSHLRTCISILVRYC